MKVEGSNITITDSVYNKMSITPKGACEQDTTAYIDVGTWEQGSIYGNTGENADTDITIRTKEYIEVKPNVLYNITRSIATNYQNFRFYDVSKSYLGNQGTASMVTTNQSDNRMIANVYSMTMTINNTNVAYMRITDNSNDLSTIYTISTQAPTPDYPQDIRNVTGDNEVVVSTGNLLDSKGGFERGYISSTGVFNAEDYTALFNQYIPINENVALTLSSKFSLRSCAYIFYDENKTFISRSANINVTNFFTVTTPQNTKYIKIQVSRQIQLITQEIIDELELQVEFGLNVTSYKEFKGIQTYTLHLGTNYLAGIGDYKDEIVGKTDDWKIRRYVRKLTFVGTENWQRSTNYINTTMYYLEHGLSNLVPDPFLSNYFTFMLGNDDIPHIRWGGTGNSRFFIFSPILNNVDSFKTWLSTHNTEVYYILDEPVEETITDTQLIEDLNALQDMLSYDGTTNITVTSEDTNAQMEVEVTYTSKSDMYEKLLFIFNKMKDKLYHIIRSL